MGGGFLYTNENTLSLGLVVVSIICMTQKNRCRKCWKISTTSGRCTADRGRQAGGIFRYVVPEAGINMLPELVGDGVLLPVMPPECV